MVEVIVLLKDVWKTYATSEGVLPVLRGVNMMAYRGELVGIHGPSGSGKTTLLRVIAGLERPDRGEVIVDGYNLNMLDDYGLAMYRNTVCSYIPQDFAVIDSLTVLENVEIPLILAGVSSETRVKKVLEVLEYVGLKGKAGQKVAKLSGGERQRVAIARALYLLSGVGATLFHTASTPVVGLESVAIPAVGASGAISGVLGAYMMFFPGTSLIACFPIFFFPACFTLRASAYLAFWFVTQIVYGYMRIGGIAFFAHAGGFIAGVTLAWALGLSRVRELKFARSFLGFFKYIVLKVHGEGLGTFTKAVLVVLIVFTAVTLGYYASNLGEHTIGIYQGYLRVNGVSDIVLLKVLANGSYDLSESQYTDVNIVLTRLSKIGFLVNRSYSGRVIDTSQNPLGGVVTLRIALAGYLEIEEAVPVAVYAKAMYDDAGVLVRGEGSIVTQVVVVRAYRVEKIPMTYSFSYSATGPYETEPVQIAAIPSVALSLASAYVIARKDQELSVG